MGRRARYIPARLPEKLLQIRKSLGLTQEEMLKRLDLPEEILQTSISQYERGKIEPPIFVLLRYADVINVWLEVLLRDQLELPDKLPSTLKHEGVRRPATVKSGRQCKKST
jgi:transcriptional regulator with XRE-family HTH domain